MDLYLCFLSSSFEGHAFFESTIFRRLSSLLCLNGILSDSASAESESDDQTASAASRAPENTFGVVSCSLLGIWGVEDMLEDSQVGA